MERLSQMDVKRDLRDTIKKLKRELTYDEFLTKLITDYSKKEDSK